MVEHLIDHIMSPNTELKTEINICRSSHLSTFIKVSTYLSTVFARLYPSANPSSVRFRKCNIYAAGRGDRVYGRGGRFNGRVCGRGCGGRGGQGRGGQGRGGCGGGTGAHENGIDISYVIRYFEDSEWAALSNDTRKRITEDLVRTNYWQIKRGAPPALSVLERTTRTGWSLRSSLGFKTQAEMNLDCQEE